MPFIERSPTVTAQLNFVSGPYAGTVVTNLQETKVQMHERFAPLTAIPQTETQEGEKQVILSVA